MSHRRRRLGFTLFELLITIAIIGILSALVVPSLESIIIKSRRSEAKTSLYDLAERLERFYLQYQSYTAATIGQNSKTDVLDSNLTASGYYELAIIFQKDSTYLLQATPSAQSSQLKDKECKGFRLDSLGQKTITGTGDPNKCWD